MSGARDLLLYVHIPFCQSKCHFCDWVTGIATPDLKLDARAAKRRDYIAALTRQIRVTGARLTDEGYRARLLYWGGGTASALEPDEFERVVQALHDTFDLSGLAEATLESSPETLTPAKLALARQSGFTRLSIGIQSLDDDRLRAIGRAHDAEGAISSVFMAADAGFQDVNLDLISGFPGETLDEFEASLERVLTLPFNHCSLYPYRPAPGTVMLRSLNRHRTSRTWLEEQLDAYELGRTRLTSKGLPEYAFSHFGRPRCRSDLAYFRLDMDWFGFGAGATSVIGGRYRATERGGMQRFIDAPLDSDEDIPALSPAIAGRLAYQALTLPEGIVRTQWEERLHAGLDTILDIRPVRGLLDHFDRTVSLVREHDSIHIPADRIARAFITLLFLNTPAAGQQRTAARAAVGGY
jgi:coproporphyrinogen III oxidase-like Fe-S oxidoreductase